MQLGLHERRSMRTLVPPTESEASCQSVCKLSHISFRNQYHQFPDSTSASHRRKVGSLNAARHEASSSCVKRTNERKGRKWLVQNICQRNLYRRIPLLLPKYLCPSESLKIGIVIIDPHHVPVFPLFRGKTPAKEPSSPVRTTAVAEIVFHYAIPTPLPKRTQPPSTSVPSGQPN